MLQYKVSNLRGTVEWSNNKIISSKRKWKSCFANGYNIYYPWTNLYFGRGSCVVRKNQKRKIESANMSFLRFLLGVTLTKMSAHEAECKLCSANIVDVDCTRTDCSPWGYDWLQEDPRKYENTNLISEQHIELQSTYLCIPMWREYVLESHRR
jgi:hypothetical protein